MNCDIVTSFINDFDNQSVSIVNFQCWARILSIHGYGVVSFAQPLHWSCFNLHIYIHLIFHYKILTFLKHMNLNFDRYITNEKENTRQMKEREWWLWIRTTNSCSWVLGFAKDNVEDNKRTKMAMKMDEYL
jgi:hypothetical protein